MLRRLAPFILSSLLATARVAAAPVLLDRVIAIVDDRAIFRSEVIVAARPYFDRIPPPDRADPKNVDALLKQVLEKMIDAQLIEREAKRLHIEADDTDVDRGLKAIADVNGLKVEAVIAEAKRIGFTEAGYREEIRHQVLEGKWIQIRVKPKVRKDPLVGTEQEREEQHQIFVDAEKKKQLAQLRAESFVEVHW